MSDNFAKLQTVIDLSTIYTYSDVKPTVKEYKTGKHDDNVGFFEIDGVMYSREDVTSLFFKDCGVNRYIPCLSYTSRTKDIEIARKIANMSPRDRAIYKQFWAKALKIIEDLSIQSSDTIYYSIEDQATPDSGDDKQILRAWLKRDGENGGTSFDATALAYLVPGDTIDSFFTGISIFTGVSAYVTMWQLTPEQAESQGSDDFPF